MPLPTVLQYHVVRLPSRFVRLYSDSKHPLIHIPKANIYRFGATNATQPIFEDVEWTAREEEAWAVVGTGSGEKSAVFETLLGHHRIVPPPPPPLGLYPLLAATSLDGKDPLQSVHLVSFSHRPRSTGGAFYDFTARYGAIRDGDRLTLRQSMFPAFTPPDAYFLKEWGGQKVDQSQNARVSENGVSEEEQREFEEVVDALRLGKLLDLPLVALSNGQMRRARVAKALLKKPEILLLDEPLTGLDVESRPALLSFLKGLHFSPKNLRVVLGLRTQDAIPDWVTHVAYAKDKRVFTGTKSVVEKRILRDEEKARSIYAKETDHPIAHSTRRTSKGKVIVDMKNVTIRYGNRVVLNDISWKIHENERWHLQGPNGSGKSTLLSLLTGSHPQSYTQPHLHLHSRPREALPTPLLASLTSLVSPELGDAFPHAGGMTVEEVVGTGFDGTFLALGSEGVGIGVMQPVTPKEIQRRVRRRNSVVAALGPLAWGSDGSSSLGQAGISQERLVEFGKRKFRDLSHAERRVVLLMRALVGRAPLVLLDEVWSGMDSRMGRAVKEYLRREAVVNGLEDSALEHGLGRDQACVVVTHWEDEVPWKRDEGVKVFRLDESGMGRIVE